MIFLYVAHILPYGHQRSYFVFNEHNEGCCICSILLIAHFGNVCAIATYWLIFKLGIFASIFAFLLCMRQRSFFNEGLGHACAFIKAWKICIQGELGHIGVCALWYALYLGHYCVTAIYRLTCLCGRAIFLIKEHIWVTDSTVHSGPFYMVEMCQFTLGKFCRLKSDMICWKL